MSFSDSGGAAATFCCASSILYKYHRCLRDGGVAVSRNLWPFPAPPKRHLFHRVFGSILCYSIMNDAVVIIITLLVCRVQQQISVARRSLRLLLQSGESPCSRAESLELYSYTDVGPNVLRK